MAATIIPNDDSAAASNRAELQSTSTRLVLPAGKVSVDSATIHQRANAGAILTGNATALANVVPSHDWVAGRALAVRPGPGGDACLSFYEPPESRPEKMPANQVGWLFDPNGSDGLGFYPAPVQRIKPLEAVPQSPLSFMRAYHGVPFDGHGPMIQVAKGHGFKKDDDVFCTDGPLINECVGEWRTIRAVTVDTVVIDKPLVQRYKQGTICGGPWPRKLAYQGLRFNGTWGPVLLQQSVDVRFADCIFDQVSGWVSVIGCGRVQFVNCSMPSGFQSSASHDIKFRGCSIAVVVGEQGANDLSFTNCRIGPGTLDSKVQCLGWTLKECVTHAGLYVYDSWLVEDHISYGPTVIRGRGAVVRELWSSQPVIVQAMYQGQPQGAGTNVTLDRITAPYIQLEPGTSGVIRGRSCQVVGDLSKWTITPKMDGQ